MALYTDALIAQIWEKATPVEGYDSTRWRKDFAGAWIQKDQYGIQSPLGWEIDHLIPLSKGGSDDLSNMTPLQWENNRTKSHNTPIFKTSITSCGNKNIGQERVWTISK